MSVKLRREKTAGENIPLTHFDFPIYHDDADANEGQQMKCYM